MNSIFPKFWHGALFLFTLATLSFVGCAPFEAPKKLPDTRGIRGSLPPKYHIHDLLTTEGMEEHGYAMYTYVLFGCKIKKSDTEVGERYQSLLNAIMLTLPTPDEGSPFPKNESNIFYIPWNKSSIKVGEALLKDYNFSLAMKYIGLLRKSIRDDPQVFSRLGSGSGPFLISLLYPFYDTKGETTYMLYADLSDNHPYAMREIVDAYKKRLSLKPLDGIQRFNPIRLSVLNFILNANDNLKIVKLAVADLVP